MKAGQTSESVLESLLSYFEIYNQNGATINKSNADEKIKELFDLSKSALIGSELNEFLKKSNSQLQHNIFNEIGGYHIDRSELISDVQKQLAQKKIVII